MTRLLFDTGLGANFAFKVAPLIAFGTHMFAHTHGVIKECFSFPSLSHPHCSLWAPSFGCFLSHNRITREGGMLLTKFLLYCGVLLVSFSSSILYYLYLRLRGIGKHYVAFNLPQTISKDYLRNRTEYGWPTWPVYLMWALLACGLVVFVIGVFRLR